MLGQREKRGTHGLGENNLAFRIKKMQHKKKEHEVFRRPCLSRDREVSLPLAAGCSWREGRKGCLASEENSFATSQTKSGIFKAGG